MPKPPTLRALCAALLCLVLAAGCADNSPEALLEKAAAARAEGDLRTAEIHLKNLLRANPDHPEARIRLGEVAFDLDDPVTAEKEFRTALELGADLGPIRAPLGRAMLAQGKARETLEFLDLGSVTAADERGPALLIAGRAHYALGDADRARQAFEAAIELDKSHIDAYTELARLLIDRNEREAAEALIQRALEIDATHVPSLMLQSMQHFLAGEFAESESVLKTVLELEADSQGRARYNLALAQLIETQLQQNKLSEARASADALIAEDAGVFARYLRAQVAIRERDNDLAQRLLLDLLSDAPDFHPAESMLGAVYAIKGNVLQAEMHLERALIGNPDDEFARRVLAELSLRRNDPDRAMLVLRPALRSDRGVSAEVLSLAGHASLQAGQRDAAFEYFRQSIEANPDNLELQLQTAITMVMTGDTDRAIALLEALPEDEQEQRAAETIRVLAAIRDGGAARAIAMAGELAEAHPTASWTHNLLGAVHLANNDLTAARSAFERAEALDPNDVATLQNLARVELAGGDTGAARQQYERILESDESDYEALIRLADLELRSGGSYSKARDLLEQARTERPAAVEPKLMLARLELERGDPAMAVSLAREALTAAPRDADAYNVLGLAQLKQGNADEALASFAAAIRIVPAQAHYHLNRAQAHAAKRDAGGVLQALNDALDADNSILPPYDLVSTLALSQQHFAQAESLLEKSRSASADAVETRFLEGSLRQSQGQHGAAAEAFADAYRQRPNLNTAIRLFQSRAALGRSDATTALEDWATRHPEDANAAFSLAAGREQIGDLDGAIAQYEAIVARNPTHAFSLNNLAVLYHARSDSRALATAQRAFDNGGNHPAILDTFGWLNVQEGDVTRGVTLLEAAAARSDTPEIRYHLAVGYQRNGQADEARQLLETLLASGRPFDGRAEAEALLESLRN